MSNQATNVYPWERREKEPADWFARFERYRLMGPLRRSVVAAWRAEEANACNRPGTGWWANSKRWDWQTRAEAWDAHERQRTLVELAEDAAQFRRELLELGRRCMQETIRRADALQRDTLTVPPDVADVVALGKWAIETMERALIGPQLDAMRLRLEALEKSRGQ